MKSNGNEWKLMKPEKFKRIRNIENKQITVSTGIFYQQALTISRWWYFRCPARCQPDVQPDADQMLAGCRPDASRMPAGCWPDAGCQPNICSSRIGLLNSWWRVSDRPNQILISKTPARKSTMVALFFCSSKNQEWFKFEDSWIFSPGQHPENHRPAETKDCQDQKQCCQRLG